MAIEVGSTAGSLVQLAPDLDFPSTLESTTGYKIFAITDAVGSLATALSLTGKYSIDMLNFDSILSEQITIKLTIDGVVIWNDTFTSVGSIKKLIGGLNNGTGVASPMQCKKSLLLQVQTTTDAQVTLQYLVRPIL